MHVWKMGGAIEDGVFPQETSCGGVKWGDRSRGSESKRPGPIWAGEKGRRLQAYYGSLKPQWALPIGRCLAVCCAWDWLRPSPELPLCFSSLMRSAPRSPRGALVWGLYQVPQNHLAWGVEGTCLEKRREGPDGGNFFVYTAPARLLGRGRNGLQLVAKIRQIILSYPRQRCNENALVPDVCPCANCLQSICRVCCVSQPALRLAIWHPALGCREAATSIQLLPSLEFTLRHSPCPRPELETRGRFGFFFLP